MSLTARRRRGVGSGAPAFVAVSSRVAFTGGTVFGPGPSYGGTTVPKPAGALVGDRVIVAVRTGDTTQVMNVGVETSGVLTGFDALEAVRDGSGTYDQLAVFSRVLDGSEGANFGVQVGDTGVAVVVACLLYRPARTVEVHGKAGSGFSSSTSIVAPTVTALTPGRLVTVFGSNTTAGASTPPGSMTSRYEDHTIGLLVADEKLTAAGATGTRTATQAASAAWFAVSLVLAAT